MIQESSSGVSYEIHAREVIAQGKSSAIGHKDITLRAGGQFEEMCREKALKRVIPERRCRCIVDGSGVYIPDRKVCALDPTALRIGYTT